MVKHIKLFENWAEENVELPWYLDPSKKYEVLGIGNNKSFNIWNDEVQKHVRNTNCNIFGKTFRVNFKSFSDYAFWLPQYTKLVINQEFCYYTLEDCFGIPECQTLYLYYTNIKSLKVWKKESFMNSL